MAETDVRVLVPRVRRALDVTAAVLSDDDAKDLVADAIADIILYTGSAFGKQLIVTATDNVTSAPSEYATNDELTLPEQSVVAAQAALNYFFHEFANMKTSEKISDEARTWEYATSAQLVKARFDLLIRLRDDALSAIESGNPAISSYVSFVASRDAYTAQAIEPWVGIAYGGQEDFRFGAQDDRFVGY